MGPTVTEATATGVDGSVPDGDPLILVERVGPDRDVVLLTLNRPEQRNPLDKATIRRLRELLTALAEGDTPRAIVLTGAGPAFSAGGDLKGYQTLYRDTEAFAQFMEDFSAAAELLERGPMLTVAMINGACVAGGTELSLACDFVTIADDARIGDGHLRFAQLPGAGGSQRLIRAIGVQRARHWLLTGRLFPARDAVDIGLALFSAPAAELRTRTLELVEEIGRLSPLAVQTMKRLVSAGLVTGGLDAALAIETQEVFDYATTSYDATEGLNAFAERRPPEYKGR